MGRYRAASAFARLTRAIDSGDDDVLANALASDAWPLLNRHFQQFTEALESLPASVVRRHYPLELYHPLAGVVFRGPSGPSPVGAEKLKGNDLAMFHLARLLTARVVGDSESLSYFSDQLEHWAGSQARTQRDAADGPVPLCFIQVGYTSMLRGDLRGALRHLGIANSLALRSQLHDGARHAYILSSLSHSMRGAVAEARVALEDAVARPILAPELYEIGVASAEAAARAIVSIETGGSDADALVAALSPIEMPDETWVFKLLARVRHALMRHRAVEAIELVALAQATQRVAPGSLAADVIPALRIEALLESGLMGEARRFVDRREGTRGILTQVAVLRMHVMSGDRQMAGRAAAAIVALPALSVGVHTEVLTLLAWADHLAGEQVSANTAAQLAGYAAQGGRRLLSVVPRDVIAALAATLDTNAPSLISDGPASRSSEIAARLTRGELRVLRELAEGRSNTEVAAILQLSPHTVKTHVSSILRKLGVSTRAAAITTAARQGLIESAR
ncbi:hypothetical protein GCM10027421_36210 [Microbacterium shaanxiense]